MKATIKNVKLNTVKTYDVKPKNADAAAVAVATFDETMRAFENADAADAAAVYEFGKAVTFSVFKKVVGASFNDTIQNLRDAAKRDAHALNRTDGLAFDTYNDGLDLIHIAIMVALSERAALSDDENMETVKTRRVLNRRVLIKDDDAPTYKDVETCGVTETHRAVRRGIESNRHAVTDPRSKYMYIMDVAKSSDADADADNDAAALETIYRRLPRFYQIAAACDIHGTALCNATPSINAGLIDDVADVLNKLNLTAQQSQIIKYRCQGYGYKAIATAMNIERDNVKGQCKEIKRKFERIFSQRVAAAEKAEKVAMHRAAVTMKEYRAAVAPLKAERAAFDNARRAVAIANTEKTADAIAKAKAARDVFYSQRAAVTKETRDAAKKAHAHAAAAVKLAKKARAAAAAERRNTAILEKWRAESELYRVPTKKENDAAKAAAEKAAAAAVAADRPAVLRDAAAIMASNIEFMRDYAAAERDFLDLRKKHADAAAVAAAAAAERVAAERVALRKSDAAARRAEKAAAAKAAAEKAAADAAAAEKAAAAKAAAEKAAAAERAAYNYNVFAALYADAVAACENVHTTKAAADAAAAERVAAERVAIEKDRAAKAAAVAVKKARGNVAKAAAVAAEKAAAAERRTAEINWRRARAAAERTAKAAAAAPVAAEIDWNLCEYIHTLYVH